MQATNKIQKLFILLIFSKSALHVSGDKFAYTQEHFTTIYSFWYNAPTMLPTGATFEHRCIGRQQRRCIVPKAVYTVKSAPEDGRICLPKHVGLI